MRFIDLDTAALTDSTVLLDVDGTLVTDSSKVLSAEVRAAVAALAGQNTVYLASNGDPARTSGFAQELGVAALPQMHKPRVHPSLAPIIRHKRVVVIGDKVITDGWLAASIGADFIHVDSLRAASDRVLMRFFYLLDGVVSATVPYIALARPQQYVKNVLVFAPIFFAGEFFVYAKFTQTLIAFLVFCFAASLVYTVNDIADSDLDRQHPKKRHRPLAARRISRRAAVVFAVLLGSVGVLLGSLVPSIAPVIVLYVVANLLYSFLLKHIAVVDVVVVTSFYLMRLIVGGQGGQVPLSQWIVLCVFFGALFLVTGKRLAEFRHRVRRRVFMQYSEPVLRMLFLLSGFLAVLSYALYSVWGHASPYLGYTAVVPVYAYMRIVHRMRTHPDEAESPDRMLFRDVWILGAFLVWALVLLTVFYSS